MEFLRLLEIDRSLVAPEAEKSLLLVDRVWCEEGCPREPSRLVAVLEKILQRCLSSGLWYAPILLRRKKGLERGTWRPPAYTSGGGKSPSLPASASPATREKSDEDCATCGGTGVIILPGGFTGTLCPCGTYLRRLQQK
jgi:hypothetical protein